MLKYTDELEWTLYAHEVVKGYEDIVYIDGSNTQWTVIETDFKKFLLLVDAPHESALLDNLSMKVEILFHGNVEN